MSIPQHPGDDGDSLAHEIAALDKILSSGYGEWDQIAQVCLIEPITSAEAESFMLKHYGRRELVPQLRLASAANEVRTVEKVTAALVAADVLEGAHQLNRLLGNPDRDIRRSALESMSATLDELEPTAAPASTVPNRVFQMGSRLDQLLGRWLHDARTKVRVARSWETAWTVIGIVITFAVVGLFLTSHWLAAGLLLMIRQMVSARWGAEANLPLESRSASTASSPFLGRERGHLPAQGPSGSRRSGTILEESGPAAMYRCLAGHFCDALILSGLAVAMVHHGWLIGALITLIALLAMLFGTMMRIAAIQTGIRIYRLNIERIVRVWPIWIACFASAFVSPILMMSLAALGPLSYGVGELLRCAIRIRHEFRQAPVRTVRFTSWSESGSGEVVSFDRVERRYAPPKGESADSSPYDPVAV